MPSTSYSIAAALVRLFNVSGQFDRPEDEVLAMLERSNAKVTRPPDSFYRKYDVRENALADGTDVFVIGAKGARPRLRVLFLHGGGGMIRPMPPHFSFVSKLVERAGAEVWFPFYPLAPAANAQGALDAVVDAYAQLPSDGLSVYVAGDSAGANLSLSLCRVAIDKGMPLPEGIVAISPASGFERPDYKQAMAEVAKRDVLLGTRLVDMVRTYWAADMPLDSWALNPAFIDYAGFPCLLVFNGTDELFYPFVGTVLDRMRAGAAEVEHVEGAGLCHDWALVSFFPEGREALETVLRFLRL